MLAHLTLVPHDPDSLNALRAVITLAAAGFQLAVFTLTKIITRKGK